jgi:hypothetical protein
MSLYKKGFYVQLEKFLIDTKHTLRNIKVDDYKKKARKMKLGILAMKVCNKINSKWIIDNFNEKMTEDRKGTTIKENILKENANFFINTNFKTDLDKAECNTTMLNINDILDIKDVWTKFNKKQQEQTFKHLKMLVILSERYQNSC